MLSNMHLGLTPELIRRAEDELGETEEVRTQGLKELKRLIQDEPDFNPCTDDAFLTRFLRARKHDVGRAFKTLKNYYVYKAQNSGVITDLKPSDFFSKVDKVSLSVLEHRDQNQSIVGYLRIGHIDLNKFSPLDVLAMILLGAECVLQSEANQVAGYCLVADMAGFSLGKARHFASPTFLYKSINAIQDCYPSRIKAFHFVNEPFYFDIVLSIMRSFMSEKLKNRLHFHGSNMESLHEHLNPKHLPKELGGELRPSEIYEKKFLDLVREHEDYYVRMNQFGYTGKTLLKLTKENHSSSKKDSS